VPPLKKSERAEFGHRMGFGPRVTGHISNGFLLVKKTNQQYQSKAQKEDRVPRIRLQYHQVHPTMLQ